VEKIHKGGLIKIWPGETTLASAVWKKKTFKGQKKDWGAISTPERGGTLTLNAMESWALAKFRRMKKTGWG